jgi:hypothetical protein
MGTHRCIVRVLDLDEDQQSNMARTIKSKDMHDKCAKEVIEWIEEQFKFNTQDVKD